MTKEKRLPAVIENNGVSSLVLSLLEASNSLKKKSSRLPAVREPQTPAVSSGKPVGKPEERKPIGKIGTINRPTIEKPTIRLGSQAELGLNSSGETIVPVSPEERVERQYSPEDPGDRAEDSYKPGVLGRLGF